MIRYQYVNHLTPPAPFVNVRVRCPQIGNFVENVPGQIDPAADRTVLPGPLVANLGLLEDGRLHFQGFAGDLVELPVFLVEIQLHDLPAILIRAALGEMEPYVLLGRDVLNSYRILLDGPQLALEIG